MDSQSDLPQRTQRTTAFGLKEPADSSGVLLKTSGGTSVASEVLNPCTGDLDRPEVIRAEFNHRIRGLDSIDGWTARSAGCTASKKERSPETTS